MREDCTEVELGEICDLKSGFAFKSKDYIKLSNTMNFRMSQIRPGGKVDLQHNPMFLPDEFKDIYEDYLLNEGDIVIAMTDMASDTKILGVPTQIKQTNINLLLNQRVGKITGLLEEYISFSYLRYIITSPQVYSYYKKLGKGGMQINLGKNDILNAIVPLAPLPIQRAIVSKIEALFSDLDNGIANFTKAQDQLKIYRQAVLKKAFEGELTKEWREKQSKLPSAEELLNQIKEERQNHYNQQMEDWKKAVKVWEKKGSVGKKPKKPSALTIPDKPNAEHISRKWELPDNWTWTQIGEVCFVTKLAGFEYTDYVKYEADGDLAVIKAENAGLNGFKKTQYSKIKSESVKMLTRSMIYGGELLVVFVGAGTGNVATVPQNKLFFLGPNIGMARPYFEINTRYIELFLQSPQGKHMLIATVKAVAQPSLSMGTIRQTPFVFCSLEEQYEIIQEIEFRLSVCDKMEQSINESIEKAEVLRQSILKKAFEGKLLSEAEIEHCKTAADYEPASELLKKIQAKKLAKELEKKKPTIKKKSKK